MIIKNGQVFNEDGTFEIRDLYVENHKIVASREELTDFTEIDATGLKVIPGLIDIHSHGAFGHDFSDNDVEGLKAILRYEREHGITSYCPTSVTLPLEKLKEIYKTAELAEGTEGGARLLGINMEGPFIQAKKKGAHEESYISNSDIDFFNQCNESCKGRIKLVTLAPDTEGAGEFIEKMHDKVCISLGHTAADYKTAREAMEKGAHHVTHLFNAMMPFAHRDPGLVGAAFDDKECMVELICDGFHIHPAVVRSVFTMFGAERVILISDSMMATGMENGQYVLGELHVTMKDRKATLKDGTLAGSATNLFDCMKTAVSFGIPLADAVFAATRNPARSIGVYDQVGSLVPGKEADILLVDDQLNLKQVL